MRVVDRDHERPAGGEVGGKPVQAVQDRERRIVSRGLAELTGEQRSRSGGRPGEQRFTLVCLC
jgi:hypothetical protein